MRWFLISLVLGGLGVLIPIWYISGSVSPKYKKSVVQYDPITAELEYRQEKVQAIKEKIKDIEVDKKVQEILDKLEKPQLKDLNNKLLEELKSLVPTEQLNGLEALIEDLRIVWEPDQRKVEIGKNYYKNYCMTCHGFEGDSLPVTPEGLRADLGYPIFARDFTGKYHRDGKVVFKYASSFAGEMASDNDLKKIIKEGLPGTPMPGYPYLTDSEIDYILEYIKSLNHRWKFYKGRERMYPTPPTDLDQRVESGRQTFQSICIACHRNPEQGEEPLEQPLAWYKFDKDGKILKDEFQTVRARYFGKEPLRRGEPEEIFVTIQEGIAGSTMTPWRHIGEEKIWDLVAYVIYLQQQGGNRNASR